MSINDENTLSAKQDKALAGLISQPTIADAAESAGVSKRSILRWLKDSPEFNEAYRMARNAIVKMAISRTQTAMAGAVDALTEIMGDSDAPASARVSAARAILDSGLRGMEAEDLEARITVLEKELNAAR